MHELLKTDKYKFVMAEAGYPLRKETFYYAHRKGGPHFLPFDIKKEITKSIFGEWNSKFHTNSIENAYDWLDENVQTIGAGFREAFCFENIDNLEIKSLPPGSWFFDNEPVFTITGMSAVVSWLEPLIIRLNYKIQLATLALMDEAAFLKEAEEVTCGEQADIIINVVKDLNKLGFKVKEPIIKRIFYGKYSDEIEKKAEALIKLVGPNRIFEVGMRSVTCKQQHMVALEACSNAGIRMTSNVYQAWNMDLKPVGTMGHEHVQRFGSDKEAFRAMADRIPEPVFCLLDTFDTINSGIKNAYNLISDQPHRDHAVRFDSGDTESLFKKAYSLAQDRGIKPRFCFEDGWNYNKTIKFEHIRNSLSISPDRFLYGYGGHLVRSEIITLDRDRVGAIWKLSKSGDRNTMKFSDDPGKQSVPGNPVILRRKLVTSKNRNDTMVAQENEQIPAGYISAFEQPAIVQKPQKESNRQTNYSRKTQEIINRLLRKKEKML